MMFLLTLNYQLSMCYLGSFRYIAFLDYHAKVLQVVCFHVAVFTFHFAPSLQLYFDRITELVVSKSDSVLFKEALVSLATDSGLHSLVPYFTCFIADEVINLDHMININRLEH